MGSKRFAYLLSVTIFCAYLIVVLYYTLFQFQSLLVLTYFRPGLMLQGLPVGQSLNLIPLVTLRMIDLKTSLLNILLFIPFGFGLPLVIGFRLQKTVLAAALFSIAIEALQLITGLLAGITFRVADINDVLFNTAGAAIGYCLFIGFTRIRSRIKP